MPSRFAFPAATSRRLRAAVVLSACTLFVVFAVEGARARDARVVWGLAAETNGGGEVHLSWVQPSSIAWDQGARPGDLVLQIGGQAAGEWLKMNVVSEIDHSSPLLIKSGHGGQTLDLRWQTGRPDLGLTAALLLIGAVFLTSGSLVLLRGPDSPEARAFFGLCFAAGVMFALTVPIYSGDLWIIRMRFVFSIFVFGFFAHFFFVFPEERTLVIRGRRLPPWLVFIAPAGMGLYFTITSLFSPSLYEPGRSLNSAVVVVLSVLGVVALVLNYARASHPGTRYQLRLLVAGTIIAVAPFLVLNMVPAAFAQPYIVTPNVSVLPTVLIPLLFSYAILRYQLLGTGRVIRRLVVYFVNGVILLGTYLAVYFGTWPGAGNRALSWERYLFEGLVLIASAILLAEAQSYIKTLVDRAFFQDVYDYERTLRTLSTQIASIRSASELANHVVGRLVEILNLTFALILVRQPAGEVEVLAATNGVDERMQNGIREAVAPHLLTERDEPLRIPSGDGKPTLGAPLRTGNLSTGFLCLGPKVGGGELNPQDRAFLQAIAAQFSLGLDNVRLLNTVQENLRRLKASSEELAESRRQLQELNRRLLRAQEEERAKLAADLHDEPLQAILLLQRQMGNCPHASSAEPCPCERMADDAAKVLRRVCANLRPSLLDDLGLAPALEWLVADAGKLNGLSSLFINQDHAELRLPTEVEAAFFRVAQEAINNCLRHAKASRLIVRLWRDQEVVVLSVTDNGQGFQTPVKNSLIASGHLGIIGMRERMSLVGGRLDILSAIGQGTEVLARLELGGRQDYLPGSPQTGSGLTEGGVK